MKLSLFYPTYPFSINQKFGNVMPIYTNMGMKGHSGLDLLATHGQPVYASHDGEVSYAGVDSSEGYGVVLRTLKRFEYNGGEVYLKSIYWHLIKDIPVKVGQTVKAGEIIGYADNTGLSTGDHLHFGLKPQIAGEDDWSWSNLEQNNGYFGAIDPEPYLKYMFKNDMKIGDKNIDVANLQITLKKLGYFNYTDITWYYGNETAKAVLKFQISNCNLSWYERYFLKGSRAGPKTRTVLNVL